MNRKANHFRKILLWSSKVHHLSDDKRSEVISTTLRCEISRNEPQLLV